MKNKQKTASTQNLGRPTSRRGKVVKPPTGRRPRDYAKLIMNDRFIMSS